MVALPQTYYAEASPSIIVTFFENKVSSIGPMKPMGWDALTELCTRRRIGAKDGANIVLARFKPEADGRARRLKDNVIARTAIGLDFETSKLTGEVPPSIAEAADRVRAQGWSSCIYSSHNHRPAAPRFRIVIPLSDEIDPALPAPEVVATSLGLEGVLDRSKLGAQSVFYLPSAEPGLMADHETLVIEGAPISADWMRDRAAALLEARDVEQQRQREEALREAEAKQAKRVAAGFPQSDGLIESIRNNLGSLESILLEKNYKKVGKRYLFPDSQTGVPGVHIMRGNDGVDRVFSHHAADPLAAGNLPNWCTVKAIDVVDVVTILEFGGERDKALHQLAKRFTIVNKPAPDSSTATSPCLAEGEGEQDFTKWKVISPTSWLHKPVPEREWIVQDWLPVGCVTANYGDGGLGKTLLAQQLQTACATGKPWCGLAVEPCRSLGLYCEDDTDELHRRQVKMCDALGLSLADLSNMQLISGVGYDNVICEPENNGSVRFTPRLAELIEEAKRIEARLIVLDVAADIYSADENARAAVRRFVGKLNSIAYRLQCAVLLNAHPSREGMKSGRIDGASTAWNNSVRSRWSLERPTAYSDGSQPGIPTQASR